MKFTKTSENCCVVTELKNVRKHPNADKLQIATVLGDSIIVGLDAKENDKVLYFDSNLCLSQHYCHVNNLFSNHEANIDKEKKGYFSSNGKVKPTNLRGEKSYGFVAYPDSLTLLVGEIDDKDLPLGLEFNSINGIKICEKFIVKSTRVKGSPKQKKKRRQVESLMFPQHYDTKQFKRECAIIPTNQIIYITLKIHGTSGRIANVLAEKKLNWFKHLLNKLGADFNAHYRVVMHGSRRVNLTKEKGAKAFYSGDIREVVFNKLKDHVKENEQLFFEICGYDTNGTPLQKGFSYGCKTGEHRIFLYRVSINTPNGSVYDMAPEYVARRAEELGIDYPPLFEKYYYDGNLEKLKETIESYTNGKDPIDSSHIREGVALHFMNKEGRWTCLKNKSFDFLMLESKNKDKGLVDIEDNA